MLEEYGSSHEYGRSENFYEKITLKKQQKFGVWLWLLALNAHLSYACESHSRGLTCTRVPENTTLFVDILGSCCQTIKKKQRRHRREKAWM